MSTIHQSRSLVFGIATMFALTLLAPVAVSAQEEVAVTVQEEVAVLAPVAAPAVVGTSGEDVRGIRAIAAERALLTGDIGSVQEEHLFAIVAAAPSWDETSGYGSVEATRAAASAFLAPVAAPLWDETSGYGAVEASRATIGYPAASTTGQEYRVLAAQQALLSHDLGSLQEDALTVVVEASIAEGEASDHDALAASRAELLAQFRAIELSLSRSLGAE